MRKFCKEIKEHATKTVGYKKLIMLPLREEENKSHNKEKIVIYAEKI